MNARAVAAALRMLADAIEAPEGEAPVVVAPPAPSRARARPVRVVPSEPVSEVGRRRARGAMRRAGIPVGEGGGG